MRHQNNSRIQFRQWLKQSKELNQLLEWLEMMGAYFKYSSVPFNEDVESTRAVIRSYKKKEIILLVLILKI